jgi:hypothetical protein
MTETLLFLHLLSAACLFCALVGFTATALGAEMEVAGARALLALWHIGLVGVFLLGIALAIDIDGYKVWDAWVLLAIGLWLGAGYTGDKYPGAYRNAGAGSASVPASVVRYHLITIVLVLLLLADMIWKPWA